MNEGVWGEGRRKGDEWGEEVGYYEGERRV